MLMIHCHVLSECMESADCYCPKCECRRAAVAAFSDGINTGFYVNSYTTKHCPTMEGVLENLRQGLERLEEQRKAEQEKLKADKQAKVNAIGRDLTKDEQNAFKGKSAFSETMRTLNRLSASYRRCYWKSGSEMFSHFSLAT